MSAVSFEIATRSFKVFLVGAALAGLGWWNRTDLPPQSRILEALRAEPVQTEVKEPPFNAVRDGQTYQVEPVHAYEIHGLIVSQHDAAGWLDRVHELWGDSINTRDLCVIWGSNFDGDNHRRLHYSSGNFTCNVETSSSEVWSRFRMNQLSNNHLLPANEEVARRLREARIGDQIRMSGWLVRYRNDRGFFRGTSVTRDDTGNGACETIYVKEYELLSRWNHHWAMSVTVGSWIMKGALAVLLLAMFVLPFLQRRSEDSTT